MVSDAIQPSHPLSSPSPTAFLVIPSIGVFSDELDVRIRWPKYWSFSFSISLSNEYSGLISFGINWFDLLAVQGTLKSFPTPQLKTSILWHSVFFMKKIHDRYFLIQDLLFQNPLKVKVKSLSVRLFATPWTVTHQAPPSIGFSRQEYWSGLPFPSPGYLPDPGIEPRSPPLQADALTSEPPGKPKMPWVPTKLPSTSWSWQLHNY